MAKSAVIIEPAEVMTIPQAGERLGQDQSTVWRKIDRGELQAQFIAGRWLLRSSDIERLRAERETHAVAAAG